jgi:dienelactone hydrolase
LAVDKLIQSLKEAKNDNFSFLRHDGAGHAFSNDQYHNYNYNKEAAEKSFEAALTFFHKNL